MTDVTVVVRNNVDYDNMYRHMEKHWPRLQFEEIKEAGIFDLWEKKFKLSYPDYRKKVKESALENLLNTDCHVIIGEKQYIEWYSSSDDSIIVPTDDDDWFAPHLKEVSKYFDDKTHLVVWRFCQYKSAKWHKPKITHNCADYMESNNWAIKKSYLKTLDDELAHKLVLHSHYHSYNFLIGNKDNQFGGVKISDDCYGMYNRHIGSLTYLRKKLTGSFKDTNKKIVNFDTEGWHSPYVKHMEGLYHLMKGFII